MARRLILDSGAVSAIAQGDRRALVWAKLALLHGVLINIPAPVLAETLTGRSTDAIVHRAFDIPECVLETTAEIAKEAGSLRFRAHSNQTIDAIVVATAARHPKSIILTSDVDDLQRFVDERPDAGLAVRSIDTMSKGKFP